MADTTEADTTNSSDTRTQEPSWAGTIADGIPHPGVREAVPDPLERYEQVYSYMSDRFGAHRVTHKRTEGGFELSLAVALDAVDAGGVCAATLDATSSQTPVAWPPNDAFLNITPTDGTLAVAAGYGFVCTGIRCSAVAQLPIAATDGNTVDGDRSPLSIPTPGVVTTLAFHDVTADALRAQLRRDSRIPTPTR